MLIFQTNKLILIKSMNRHAGITNTPVQKFALLTFFIYFMLANYLRVYNQY